MEARVKWNDKEVEIVMSRLVTNLHRPGQILVCSEGHIIAEIDKIQRSSFKKDRQRLLSSCKSLKGLGKSFEVLLSAPWIEYRKVKWTEYRGMSIPPAPAPTETQTAEVAAAPTPAAIEVPQLQDNGALLPRLLAEIGELLVPSLANKMLGVVESMLGRQADMLREEFAAELVKVMKTLDNKVDKTIMGSALDSRMVVKSSISAANNSGSGLVATRPLKRALFVSGSEAAVRNIEAEFGNIEGLKLTTADGASTSKANKSLKQTLKNNGIDLVIVHTSNLSHTKFNQVKSLVQSEKIRMAQTPMDIREAIQGLLR